MSVQKKETCLLNCMAYIIFIPIKDIDECDDGVHDCLPSLASCKNTLGSFNCSCNHGYIGDGKTNCTEPPGKIIDNFTLCALLRWFAILLKRSWQTFSSSIDFEK